MEDQKEEDGPFCKHCGYCLVGLGVGECPECGRWFDPGMKETVAGTTKWVRTWESLASFALGLVNVVMMPGVGHYRGQWGPPDLLGTVMVRFPFMVLIAFGIGFGISGLRRGDWVHRTVAFLSILLSLGAAVNVTRA